MLLPFRFCLAALEGHWTFEFWGRLSAAFMAYRDITFGTLIRLKRIVQRFARWPLLFYLAHPRVFVGGVLAGPFKGMSMSVVTTWNNPVHFFAGSYELELHRIWNTLRPLHNVSIWVIGAAEGYYVCGFAKFWNASVTAYEACERSRRVLTANVRLNGLQDRTHILGRCDAQEFSLQLQQGAPYLILCDIEGEENSLFLEDLLAVLSKTILIVETHPPYTIFSRLEALSATHYVQIINPAERNISDYPFEDWIPHNVRLRWLDERRPFPTPWLVALPKA